MPRPSLIDPSRMREVIVEAIAFDIAQGRLQPGDRLANDRVLSDDHSASRTVIREAIQHLTVRHVLEVLPGSGTYVLPVRGWDLRDPVLVATLDRADALGPALQDLLDVRRMIEAEASALAAERASDDEIAEHRRTLARMLEVRHDAALYVDAHGLFHRQILDMSHNALLIGFGRQIETFQRVVLTRYFPTVLQSSMADGHANPHEVLWQAIAERRPERARVSMLYHTQSLERIADTLYPRLGVVTDPAGTSTMRLST